MVTYIKTPSLTPEALIEFSVTEITSMILAGAFTHHSPQEISLLMEGMAHMSARTAAHFLIEQNGADLSEDDPNIIAGFQQTVERRVLTCLRELNNG